MPLVAPLPVPNVNPPPLQSACATPVSSTGSTQLLGYNGNDLLYRWQYGFGAHDDPLCLASVHADRVWPSHARGLGSADPAPTPCATCPINRPR